VIRITKITTRTLVFPLLLLVLGSFFVPKTQAMTNASDTITTSRPSASAPIVGDQAASAGQVTIFDNGSMFLASDSAVLWPNTGETLNTATIASMSANGIPSANQRVVYFAGTPPANTHHSGDTMTTAITATHTIQFTTQQSIIANGTVQLIFPTVASNTASPSATGFSFNGMASTGSGLPSNVKTNNITCTGDSNSNISGNIITCKTSSGISAGTTLTFIIGCTAQSGGVCSAFSSQLINPTKAAAAGTADSWKVVIQTTDNNGVVQEYAKVAVATVESVQVQGYVEPYITFAISGVNNGTVICGDTTNAGPGLDSTATFVNLGEITSAINISAQKLTVSTNGPAGYAITATSSGRLMNPGTGIFFNDANGGNGLVGNDATNGTNPAPAAISGGTTAFGIHPCAAGATYIPTVPAGWGSGGGASNKYANPWNGNFTNGYYARLSSYNGAASNSETDVEYAATAALTFPSGIYTTIVTYVATPIF
jgi:hypothetical protein